MDDFEAAWAMFPRKVSKKDARRAWDRLTPDQRFEVVHALPVHVRYWEMAGTAKEYIPHFSTWLHGERWSDELEMPKPKGSTDDWQRTTAGIAARAKQVGIVPRAGEDWHSLKARILAKAA